MCSLGIEPTTFALLTQCSTTEPQEHYYYICLPLCAHILYFDAAKFSIKQFALIYFTVSVVRQRNEYEKLIETRPIKTI